MGSILKNRIINECGAHTRDHYLSLDDGTDRTHSAQRQMGMRITHSLHKNRTQALRALQIVIYWAFNLWTKSEPLLALWCSTESGDGPMVPQPPKINWLSLFILIASCDENHSNWMHVMTINMRPLRHRNGWHATCTYFSFSACHANCIQISPAAKRREKQRKRNVKLLNVIDMPYPFHFLAGCAGWATRSIISSNFGENLNDHSQFECSNVVGDSLPHKFTNLMRAREISSQSVQRILFLQSYLGCLSHNAYRG